MIFVEWMLESASFRARMPFRRWTSKVEEVFAGYERGWGSVQSQRTERSQASTRGSLEVGIGGVVIDTVEMACHVTLAC